MAILMVSMNVVGLRSSGTDHQLEGRSYMAVKAAPLFNPRSFLAKVGAGRSTRSYLKDQVILSQDEPARAVFYIRKGRVKITVVSQHGKEAVIAILGPDDFFGEGCLAGQTRYMASAKTMTASTIVRVEKSAIVRVIHDPRSTPATFDTQP